jgi:two-component system sensor histidine kinase QseC
LRTPLTIVDTHLQVARMTAAEAMQQPLADAASGVARLRGTLEQLLMLARVEGRVSFDDGTSITAVEAVDRAIAAVGDGAHRVRVIAPPDPVLFDLPPQLAVVALRNLVENALRYSPPIAPVDVAIESVAGHIRFVVTDHGAGMDVEELRSATRRFWRGRTDTPGTGLGLTLVDAIARRFGGSLELAPATHQGLSATLLLPRRP